MYTQRDHAYFLPKRLSSGLVAFRASRYGESLHIKNICWSHLCLGRYFKRNKYQGGSSGKNNKTNVRQNAHGSWRHVGSQSRNLGRNWQEKILIPVQYGEHQLITLSRNEDNERHSTAWRPRIGHADFLMGRVELARDKTEDTDTTENYGSDGKTTFGYEWKRSHR